MQALLSNQVFVYAVMAVLVFAITQGFKWAFIKPWTNKLNNERVRKAINTTIYFIPYAVGILLEVLFSLYVAKTTPNLFVGALSGGAGHSVFALYERIYDVATGKVNAKKSNAKTDEEKAVENLIFGVVEDNSIDAKDNPKLKEFLNKVK